VRISTCELPIDRGVEGIALALRGGDVVPHLTDAVQSQIQALEIVPLSSISAMFSQLPCWCM
jgi:hypothetical protein